MKTVGIIDAELLANRQHRFPNLAAMKISAWHKERGDVVTLVPSYKYVNDFSRVYISCVFTDIATTIPPAVLKLPHVRYGGTGFFFDKALPLSKTVEHSQPDYGLYDSWLKTQNGETALKYYTDYSIGFLTRGCSRRCGFCVNRNARRAMRASPLKEFYDQSRKKVCLLDDNFLAYKDCGTLLKNLIETCKRDGKLFEFKQGLDIRLLTAKIAKLFQQAPYHGELIFAFDNIRDSVSIRRGLGVLRTYLPTKGSKCYILCGFEDNSWRDIASVFRRLQILWESQTIGYVMRHENHRLSSSLCRPIYTHLARWINQPQFQRVTSFREYCEKSGGKALRAAITFSKAYPDIASEFFNMKYRSITRSTHPRKRLKLTA
jgi:hypothetical protein